MKALIEKGLLKASNFRNSKMAYAYKLTPKGIEEQASVAVRFLKRKIHEYERLQQEIEELREDASRNNSSSQSKVTPVTQQHEFSDETN